MWTADARATEANELARCGNFFGASPVLVCDYAISIDRRDRYKPRIGRIFSCPTGLRPKMRCFLGQYSKICLHIRRVLRSRWQNDLVFERLYPLLDDRIGRNLFVNLSNRPYPPISHEFADLSIDVVAVRPALNADQDIGVDQVDLIAIRQSLNPDAFRHIVPLVRSAAHEFPRILRHLLWKLRLSDRLRTPRM